MERPEMIDDREVNRLVYSSVCSSCKHYELSVEDYSIEKCMAFPEGIPLEIWEGRNDHKTSYPGDNGIQYEKK